MCSNFSYIGLATYFTVADMQNSQIIFSTTASADSNKR